LRVFLVFDGGSEAFFVVCGFFLEVEVGCCLAQLLLGGCVVYCFCCFGLVFGCCFATMATQIYRVENLNDIEFDHFRTGRRIW
jgi:hypothetical protein